MHWLLIFLRRNFLHNWPFQLSYSIRGMIVADADKEGVDDCSTR